jgi:hypothetical protein
MLGLAKVGLGIGASMALAAGWVFHEGVIHIDVDEARADGSHVHLWVPATTVAVGLRLAPRRHLERAAEQMRPFLPALREMTKELQKYPNAEFVNVQSKSDHVRVVMRGGRLYVDAVSGGDNVHISFPAETLQDVADRMEEVAPGV